MQQTFKTRADAIAWILANSEYLAALAEEELDRLEESGSVCVDSQSASAPELLEALELMVKEYASAIPEDTHAADRAIDAAQAAIKKAKGE